MTSDPARTRYLLEKGEAVLVIVDIQDRLAVVMEERQRVITNCLHLIEAACLMKIPILLTEQYPKGLGPTVPELRDVLSDILPMEKLAFSCCREAHFMEKLSSLRRRQVIMTGMETHICILQTTLGLLQEGYDVHVVSDAVCSRTIENYRTGLEFLRDAGAAVTCTETVLFQLLQQAGTEEFKIISKRIK